MKIPDDIIIYIIDFIICDSCIKKHSVSNYLLVSKNVYKTYKKIYKCNFNDFLTLNFKDYFCPIHQHDEHNIIFNILKGELGIKNNLNITCTHGYNNYLFHYKNIKNIDLFYFHNLFKHSEYSVVNSCCNGKGLIFKKKINYI